MNPLFSDTSEEQGIFAEHCAINTDDLNVPCAIEPKWPKSPHSHTPHDPERDVIQKLLISDYKNDGYHPITNTRD